MTRRHDTRHKAVQRLRKYGLCELCADPIRTERESGPLRLYRFGPRPVTIGRVHWACVGTTMGITP